MSYWGRPFHHPRGHHPADREEVFGTGTVSHVRSHIYRNSRLVATRSRPSFSPRTIGGPHLHNLPYLPSFSTGVVSPLAPRYRAPAYYGSSSQVPSPVPYGLSNRRHANSVRGGPPPLTTAQAPVPSAPLVPVTFERDARGQELSNRRHANSVRGAPPPLATAQTPVPSTPLVPVSRDARGQEEATPGSVNDRQHDQSNPTSPSPDCVATTPLSSRCKPTNFKVEICRNFLTGNCPFGSSCTYAHGSSELMPRTLIDLDKLGLVDKETFRCFPCLDHVATGYCPQGSLCTCLHAPRARGAKESWVLRHCDSLAPDQAAAEVSKMHQAQLTALRSVTPVYGFAPAVNWSVGDSSSRADFFEFYGYCSNMSGDAHQVASWPVSRGSKAMITEVQRLSIALEMRKAREAQSFVFRATHLLCGEPVLLLQTRYFLLVGGHDVVSIWNDSETRGSNNAVICAREIAFGPVGDASVRPTSIWFKTQVIHA